MPRDREATLKELENSDEPTLSVEVVAAAIAYKKSRRRIKHQRDFNCYILNKDADPDELEMFLMLLERNKSRLPNNTRFQVVYRADNHWSVADVRIINNKIEFFLLDAAGSIPQLLTVIPLIDKTCPGSVIRCAKGYIQFSQKGCGTFSLDHAYRLAKIENLHEKLAQMEWDKPIGEFKDFGDMIRNYVPNNPDKIKCANPENIYRATDKVKYISPLDFKNEFVPLLRNIQSLSTFKKSHTDKHKSSANDKGITIEQYIEKNTVNTGSTTINNSINVKRKNLKKKAHAHLKEMNDDEFSVYMENCRGYADIIKEEEPPIEKLETLLSPPNQPVAQTNNQDKIAEIMYDLIHGGDPDPFYSPYLVEREIQSIKKEIAYCGGIKNYLDTMYLQKTINLNEYAKLIEYANLPADPNTNEVELFSELKSIANLDAWNKQGVTLLFSSKTPDNIQKIRSTTNLKDAAQIASQALSSVKGNIQRFFNIRSEMTQDFYELTTELQNCNSNVIRKELITIFNKKWNCSAPKTVPNPQISPVTP